MSGKGLADAAKPGNVDGATLTVAGGGGHNSRDLKPHEASRVYLDQVREKLVRYSIHPDDPVDYPARLSGLSG
eukprot:355557-Chlamydomonas_euryale.AAC.7